MLAKNTIIHIHPRYNKKDKRMCTILPCAYSEEEAKELTLQRGREIKDGRVKLVPHEEVMNDMEQLCTILSGNIK